MAVCNQRSTLPSGSCRGARSWALCCRRIHPWIVCVNLWGNSNSIEYSLRWDFLRPCTQNQIWMSSCAKQVLVFSTSAWKYPHASSSLVTLLGLFELAFNLLAGNSVGGLWNVEEQPHQWRVENNCFPVFWGRTCVPWEQKNTRYPIVRHHSPVRF